MNTCERCRGAGHRPADCEDQGRPMCSRTCPCRHGAAEPDPAPYWSLVAAGADAGEGIDPAGEAVAAGEQGP